MDTGLLVVRLNPVGGVGVVVPGFALHLPQPFCTMLKVALQQVSVLS